MNTDSSNIDFTTDLKKVKNIDPLFSNNNPFFLKGEFKVFKHCEDQVIAFKHPDYTSEGKSYVCFGYWSFKNEQDSRLCFEDLKAWAKSSGVDSILGPINFSSFHDYRLPLEDNSQVFLGEPRGSIDQLNFLQNEGYALFQRYSTYYIKDPSRIYEWGKKRSKKILSQNSDFKAISFKDFNFNNRKDELYKLIHNIFESNLAYIKASDFELNLLYNETVLSELAKCPFFLVEDSKKNLLGLFMSFIGPNVFSKEPSSVLYFKTIGSIPSKTAYNPVFFFMIHEIYRSYEKLGMDIPISFALMREGNVAEKVAKMFSDQKRSYGLFQLEF